ncbi:MAG TPA: hypothetical protein VMC48_01800, partial [Methanobacterium sp.]|nr:hypothetical protein [Methanobacterium sp.]
IIEANPEEGTVLEEPPIPEEEILREEKEADEASLEEVELEISEAVKTAESISNAETAEDISPVENTSTSESKPEQKVHSEVLDETEKGMDTAEKPFDVTEISEDKSGTIPVIKPPISFPKLKKVTEIPEDEEERLDLLLKIYESIFLAMSIGASKIMGVAPARGLTRKFLPVEDCRKLLDGVDVKNNSTIDFVKIKENAEKIPLSEREQSFKENFSKIITIIIENYGKVMGYSAFRAMIRPEFKIINESYGHLLDELGIKDQLHPELRDFFN